MLPRLTDKCFLCDLFACSFVFEYGGFYELPCLFNIVFSRLGLLRLRLEERADCFCESEIMSVVCFRWGKDEIRLKRSEIRGLEEVKSHLEVFWILNGILWSSPLQESREHTKVYFSTTVTLKRRVTLQMLLNPKHLLYTFILYLLFQFI